MVFITKIEGRAGYGAKHTGEWPFPKAEEAVMWFALGWKATNPQTVHVQPNASSEQQGDKA